MNDPEDGLVQTGLWKTCRRCAAIGEVMVDLERHDFVVVWRLDGKMWSRDTGLKCADLIDSEFGCGYCSGRAVDDIAEYFDLPASDPRRN